MKFFAIPLFAGAVLCCTQAPAQKLESKEHIKKEFTLSQSASAVTMTIYNINGSIRVEGYDGNQVVLEVDQTISGKSNAILETGKQEFKLNFDQKPDSIIAYIASPFDSRPNRGRRNWDGPRIEYDFDLDFVVKVPHAMNLHVSTVNGGDVNVSDVTGKLDVKNVNGAIKIANAKGAANVHTINGDVVANFVTLPPGESDFKTLNGDIKITYPPALSVDCQFKSFNGEFYTDFPETESLPVKVVKNEENKTNKTVYKLSTETRIRIGKGGPTYKFETFNGNIYIKKQS
ncbi:DUF4097 family beta strand repeat-containing protein [Dyadobacter sp. CY326]|uniref:DUF4097 family beta strand repeat-containing protein n=1 Tax=Dyadobacter sp. CY326 TaxID=2907300 RepID=UPI001F32A337|nr:DUF4097 family beta strand repeat-containing protein [Dyadobacter sp. CY326]MCE7064684.1 DUF4097 family beta strand repeat-containing protein [Dyadobacter sp. CY326]